MRHWSWREWLIVVGFAAAGCLLFYMVIASASAEKSLDVCTGQETVGHCADKCANSSDTLVSFDPVTKAAICTPAPETTTSQNTPDTELPQFVDNSVDSVDNSNFIGK